VSREKPHRRRFIRGKTEEGAGGSSLYGYCRNNPVMGGDPSGFAGGQYLQGVGDSLKPANMVTGFVSLGRYLTSGHADGYKV
jgi:hypothetical protein